MDQGADRKRRPWWPWALAVGITSVISLALVITVIVLLRQPTSKRQGEDDEEPKADEHKPDKPEADPLAQYEADIELEKEDYVDLLATLTAAHPDLLTAEQVDKLQRAVPFDMQYMFLNCMRSLKSCWGSLDVARQVFTGYLHHLFSTGDPTNWDILQNKGPLAYFEEDWLKLRFPSAPQSLTQLPTLFGILNVNEQQHVATCCQQWLRFVSRLPEDERPSARRALLMSAGVILCLAECHSLWCQASHNNFIMQHDLPIIEAKIQHLRQQLIQPLQTLVAADPE
jgi:hypothetical protein